MSETKVALMSANGSIAIPGEVLEQLKRNRETVLRAQMYEEEFRAELREFMQVNDLEMVDIPDLLVATLRKDTTRNSLDTKRLKEEQPEIVKEYTKTSPVKGGLVIKYAD